MAEIQSDCVYLALSTIFVDAKPDLLISEINRIKYGRRYYLLETVAGTREIVLLRGISYFNTLHVWVQGI
ncbi:MULTISPECIES: hypothetical protein [unclassified Sulfurimonas]|uniref:hypothetical protein n=1 Tax=unclassified Sulfurimonas TaxID=2623549 RepID=UPI0025E9AF09|nr:MULTISPECIES: hypothetical protein [unclassified Sulfurimonas]